jgi:hypothetical protein
LPISTPMFFAPNATLRSGDRRNDVARAHPADGQRHLIQAHFAQPVIAGTVRSGFAVCLSLAAVPQIGPEKN